MRNQTHKLLRAIVLGFTVAALVAPGALAAQPNRLDPWAIDALRNHQVGTTAPLGEHGTGQTRAATAPSALIGEHGTGQNGRVDTEPGSPAVVVVPAADTFSGFDWGDAAIGAAFASALALLSAGGTLAVRRRISIAH